MIRLLPFCVSLPRRVFRPFRRLARPAGVATVAKIASVPVAAGLVCFMLPVWGGAGPGVAPALPGSGAPALPVLPAQSTFGSYGGSIYGGAVDLRDILVPAPGVPILPPGDLLIMERVQVAQSQPVSVPEPSAVALMAVGLAGLAMVRRARA